MTGKQVNGLKHLTRMFEKYSWQTRRQVEASLISGIYSSGYIKERLTVTSLIKRDLVGRQTDRSTNSYTGCEHFIIEVDMSSFLSTG